MLAIKTSRSRLVGEELGFLVRRWSKRSSRWSSWSRKIENRRRGSECETRAATYKRGAAENFSNSSKMDERQRLNKAVKQIVPVRVGRMGDSEKSECSMANRPQEVILHEPVEQVSTKNVDWSTKKGRSTFRICCVIFGAETIVKGFSSAPPFIRR